MKKAFQAVLPLRGNYLLHVKKNYSEVEELLPIASLNTNGFTLSDLSIIEKGEREIIKITAVPNIWTYAHLIIEGYDSGSPILVSLLIASHSESNRHYVRKYFNRTIVVEDAERNVYIHSPSFNNWNYCIISMGNGFYKGNTITVSGISKEEFDSIETTELIEY